MLTFLKVSLDLSAIRLKTIERNKQRNKGTLQLLDQLGPEGRVGENLMKRGHHTNKETKKQTHILTTRSTGPRGQSWLKKPG